MQTVHIDLPITEILYGINDSNKELFVISRIGVDYVMDSQDSCDVSFAFHGIERLSQQASQIVKEGANNKCSSIFIFFEDLLVWWDLFRQLDEYFTNSNLNGKLRGRDLLWHRIGQNVIMQIESIFPQVDSHTESVGFQVPLSYIQVYFLFFGIRHYFMTASPNSRVRNRLGFYTKEILKQIDNDLAIFVGIIYITLEMKKFPGSTND